MWSDQSEACSLETAVRVVGWLLNVPAPCGCTSGTAAVRSSIWLYRSSLKSSTRLLSSKGPGWLSGSEIWTWAPTKIENVVCTVRLELWEDTAQNRIKQSLARHGCMSDFQFQLYLSFFFFFPVCNTEIKCQHWNIIFSCSCVPSGGSERSLFIGWSLA